jgi:hypothetical protein
MTETSPLGTVQITKTMQPIIRRKLTFMPNKELLSRCNTIMTDEELWHPDGRPWENYK